MKLFRTRRSACPSVCCIERSASGAISTRALSTTLALRHIAIDEIAVAKGHRYLTLVMDLESGAVVFVGDGKGADALKPFWKRLRPSGAKIEAVAMDMSVAYYGAVSTHLPKAKIVFDRFHVVRLFNDKPS